MNLSFFILKYLCLAVLVATVHLGSGDVLAEDCSQADMTLNTQEEVDNFQAIYGNGGTCDTVTGDLMVFMSPVSNLDGLAALTTVEQDLTISSTSTTNLDGLSNLESVGGELAIRNNDLLVNIDGLANLSVLGRGMEIYNNNSLTSLSGLSGVTGIIESVIIENNDVLASIDALSGITSLVGNLRLGSNASLTDLGPSLGINAIGGILEIYNNDALIELNGLRNLTSAGWVDIQYNETLTNVDGLSLLVAANNVGVNHNPNLRYCRGLVPLLDDLDDDLAGPGPGDAGIPDVRNGVTISDNHPDCNTIQLILDSEATADLEVFKEHSDGNPNPVDISLSCESTTTLVEIRSANASQEANAEFGIRRFIPNFNSMCTANEVVVPHGYSADESDCLDIVMTNGDTHRCEIINTQKPVRIDVQKIFRDGFSGEVSVDLNCDAGQVAISDSTASSVDDASFIVSDFPYFGTTCTATETMPVGYFQESSTCSAIQLSPGNGAVCEFINDLDTDSDGVPDSSDNCPAVANPDQTDLDGDDIGDQCDSCVVIPEGPCVFASGFE